MKYKYLATVNSSVDVSFYLFQVVVCFFCMMSPSYNTVLSHLKIKKKTSFYFSYNGVKEQLPTPPVCARLGDLFDCLAVLYFSWNLCVQVLGWFFWWPGLLISASSGDVLIVKSLV